MTATSFSRGAKEANAADKLDIAFRRNLLSARVLYEVKQELRSAQADPRLQVRDLEDFVVFENDHHEVTFYAHGDNVSVYRDGAFDPGRRDFHIPHDVASFQRGAATHVVYADRVDSAEGDIECSLIGRQRQRRRCEPSFALAERRDGNMARHDIGLRVDDGDRIGIASGDVHPAPRFVPG